MLCCAYFLSHVRLFVTPCAVACWAPPSMAILQARMLEWVAMPSSLGSSHPRDQTQVSRVADGFFTIWATRETHEYWNGEPIPSPGDLPDQELNWVDSLPAELAGKPIL